MFIIVNLKKINVAGILGFILMNILHSRHI